MSTGNFPFYGGGSVVGSSFIAASVVSVFSCFVMQYIVSFLFFFIHLAEIERAGCFTLTHIHVSIVSFLWDIGKQCRPKSDAS